MAAPSDLRSPAGPDAGQPRSAGPGGARLPGDHPRGAIRATIATQRRLVLRLVIAYSVGQFVLAAVVLWQRGAPGAFAGDFIAYYGAGKQVLAGDARRLYDLAAQFPYQATLLQNSGLAAGRPTMIPFDYPPPAAALFMPFAALPPQAAELLWLACNLAAAYLGWRVLGDIHGLVTAAPKGPDSGPSSGQDAVARLRAPGRHGPEPEGGALSDRDAGSCFGLRQAGPLALLLLLPCDWGLLSGQPVGVLLALAALSFRALMLRQDTRAGVFLGLLAVFKPQLVVVPVLGLLVLRRPLAILGTALIGVALLMTSVALVGIQGIRAYLHLLGQIDPILGNSALAVRTGAMINWRAGIAALPGVDSATATLLTAAAAILTVAVAVLACRRQRDERSIALPYLGLTAAGLVAGYHSHYQDLVVLIPPALAAFPALLQCLRALTARRRSPTANGIIGILGLSIGPAGLVLAAVSLLLVVVPTLAWLIIGIFALAWLPLWTSMAIPGLALLVGVPWVLADPVPAAACGSPVVLGAAALPGASAPVAEGR